MPETEPGTSGLAAHTAAHFDESLTWEAVAWLKSITRLPVLLKGILTAEDAALAVEYGAEGLIVSNHGGRQLDTVPASIAALPAVADAVARRQGGGGRGQHDRQWPQLGVRRHAGETLGRLGTHRGHVKQDQIRRRGTQMVEGDVHMGL